MLTRSTALALTTLLLWRFVGEGVVPVITRRPDVSRWTPSGAATAVLHPAAQQVPSAPLGGLLLVGYVAAAAARTVCHRDPA